MYSLFEFFVYLIGSIVFGPGLAIFFSFYADFWTLGQVIPALAFISAEWELMIEFGLFWLGFYCMQNLYSCVKHYLNRPPRLEWWQTEVIYQIYVKSFYDSNGDGVGDLAGVKEKLDYVSKLGAKTIWLSPINKSGGKDGGYDVTSFIDIDPVYGTEKDFDELVREVHARDMHILLDFVPNHTSDQHPWFKESSKNGDSTNPYRDYYVWYPSEDKKNPPNNWKSVFGSSAWTYSESRKAWFLHQFLPEQPDLNLRCPAVKKELEKVIRYWLETKKVDGFRVDAVKHFFESKNFENEPPVNSKLSIKDTLSDNVKYDDLEHVHTANQRETYELLYEWRQIFEEISRRTNSTRALVVEATYNVDEIGSYYWYKNKPNAHFAFNFQLCFLNDKLYTKNEQKSKLKKTFNPLYLQHLITDYVKHLPRDSWSNWQLGNHDQPRIASRIGKENINLANALYLLLGGTAVTYYGEEIGMENLPKEHLKFEDCQDESGKRHGPKEYLEYTRDFQRTPMQWDSSKNAGFSRANKTWLLVNNSYGDVNVNSQEGRDLSHLKIYQDLVKLREQPSFQWGIYKEVVVNDQVYSFIRRAFGFTVYLVVMNLSDTNVNVNLLKDTSIAPRGYVKYYIPGKAENAKTAGDDIDLIDKYKLDAPVLTKSVFLKARDCLILSWKSSD